MKVQRKILFTISVLLSFLLIYILIRVVISINTMKVYRVFYVEIIFLVLNFISSIVIFLLIARVNLLKVSWLTWTYVSSFNTLPGGFFIYNLIGFICLSKRKNKSN